MGKKTKTGSSRKDKFYRLAKEQGFRSRAAFKLLQLNKKYNFLQNARCLIDLCAAPGGWMQVAAKYMPPSSLIIGLDLDPIKPIPNTISMVEDITTAKCRKSLKGALNDWKADVVIHDGSPNVGGAWAKDAYGQSELVLHAAKLACEFLAPGGMFVSKVFRSKDYNSLLWVMKQLFSKVEVTKPEASRSTSAEIYFICKGYLNPSKIDPEMFKPESIFQDSMQKVSEDLTVNGLHKEMLQKKRQRSGYEDGIMLLHKKLSVSDYIQSDHPISLLAEYNSLVFDEDSKDILKDSLTNEEVQDCCKDLKVLGKREFAVLLKWHKALNKKLKSAKEESMEVAEKDAEEIKDSEELLDEKLQASIEEMKKKEQARLKRLRKKRRELKFRASQISSSSTSVHEDLSQEDSLFALDQIHDEEELEAIREGEMGDISSSDEDEDQEEKEVEDEDEQRLENMEEELNHLFQEYRQRRNIRVNKEREQLKGIVSSDEDEEKVIELIDDEEIEVQEHNPLLNDLGMKKENLFFERDLFKEASKIMEMEEPKEKTKVKKRKVAFEEVPEQEEESTKENKGFEVVPMEEIANWSDDSDAEAEVLALGTAMLRKKKREELINASYNRYAFHDRVDELPEWFVADEQEHNRPQVPITKNEVNMFKAKLREISARPIKKIMEAKARKKEKALKKFEAIKNKAQAIIDNSDMSEKEKLKRIQNVYKKKQTQKEKVYVVSKRGGGTFGKNNNTKGKRVVRVDTRMKADKKGMERAMKRKKKAGRR